jgi:CBS domain-containing protein
MAAIDPVVFLRSTAPFHALPRALFDAAARRVEVIYHPAGTRLARVGGEPLRHLYVIRKGSVRLERDGQTLQLLEVGETFGYTSLIAGEATMEVVVEEDLVAFRLPGQEFRRLLADAQFARHFAVGLAERLRSSLEHSPVATFQANLSLEVRQLLRRPAAWVGPEAAVGEAARLMRDERISSVLVRTDPPGILTDRDFRNRVLAAGLGPDTPVTQVFTRPLRTVEAATPIYAAWQTLLDAGVHHLPVTRGGEIAGVLTSTDLLRCNAQGPMAVLRTVERLPSRDALSGYATRVAEMASSLLAGRLDASVIAGFVARLNDVLLARILHWAEKDLGSPPAPYAWMVFGSEGRMEQTLLTDQDNALVYAEEGVEQRDWFQAFAEKVNADLEVAGFPACTGGYMARAWHGPLSEWAERFAGWIEDPNPKALLVAAIFFDFRRVGGVLDLGPLEAVLGRASQRPAFLRLLAKAALEFQPRGSLLLRLEGGTSEVDLKLHGISPVVFLARCYGLEVGSRARSTLDRLAAATQAGLMDEDLHASVSEAYRFLVGLRLRLQLRQLSEGRPSSSKVALSDFSAVERGRLKDAFRAIRGWQEKAAYHYQTAF